MSILKKLAGETLSYGFSTILGRSLNFLLVFVHTIAFLPAELGINVKLYGYMAIANIIYTYGMETAYFRYAKEAPAKYYNIILSAIIGNGTIGTMKSDSGTNFRHGVWLSSQMVRFIPSSLWLKNQIKRFIKWEKRLLQSQRMSILSYLRRV